MSKRALKAGMKMFPKKIIGTEETMFGSRQVDANEPKRVCFMTGYMQAEKDLALTIEDLELLHMFLYAVKNNKQGCFTFTRLNNEQYEEVLRRFNEIRKK